MAHSDTLNVTMPFFVITDLKKISKRNPTYKKGVA